MYNSPITQILSDITDAMLIEQEKGIIRAVQNVGFDVNKAELEKALAYDRGQYEKGYADAMASRPQGEWKRRLVDSGFNADWVCSECGYRVKTDFVSFNYCPNCGCRMKGADDDNKRD